MSDKIRTVAKNRSFAEARRWHEGALYIADMFDNRPLRIDVDGGQTVAAQSNSPVSGIGWLPEGGNAYVGNFGFSLHPPSDPVMAVLAKVTPNGVATPSAGDLLFPNGMAITSNGQTLIVAESGGYHLNGYDVLADGDLRHRRTWAQFAEGEAPDGICLDEERAVWVALPLSKEFMRVVEGGKVTHRFSVPDAALARVLGGTDRKTL